MKERQSMLLALIDRVQFETDPAAAVDRVLDGVVFRRAMGLRPEDYLEAIREALRGKRDLSEVLPGTHSDQMLRKYFIELERKLVERLKPR
jgi:hypothetical protein